MTVAPDIQGVILIDTWANDDLADWYDVIAQRTADYNVRCCVNACYKLDLLTMLPSGSRDISLLNTIQRHAWKPYDDAHMDQRTADERLLMNMIRQCDGKSLTDPRLHTPNLLNNSASVALFSIEDLLHHCRAHHNNSIRDWLVVGQAWLMCLHFRSMGLYQLSELAMTQGWNFYVTPWSVLDRNYKPVSDKSFKGSDGITWQRIPGFGYRLAGYRAGGFNPW